MSRRIGSRERLARAARIARSSRLPGGSLHVLFAGLTLLGCSASPGESPEDVTSAAASVAPPGKTMERLPNGLIKVTRGDEVGYLRAQCDESDGAKAHCHSYLGADATGKVLTAAKPSLSCSGGTGVCLGATDLQQAYAIPTTDASHTTIAIVGLSSNPNFESDMAVYRSTYGLPPCTSASGCFTVVNASGAASPLPPVSSGWAGEMELDIQMASAGCPTCKILVVEGTTGEPLPMFTTAARLGAAAASFSGGGNEASGETSLDASYAALGIGLFAATGDSGGADTTGQLWWPAVSSAFTGVGGTDLTPSPTATFPDGTYRGWSEKAWVQPDTGWGGAGWGCSLYEPKPAWQHDTACKTRTEGDVSAIAGTGVWVYSNGSWGSNFGTSVASPLVAAIYAQSGVGRVGPSYAYGSALNRRFTDITSNIGGNGTCPASYPANLCNAQPGYDSPTGNGSPYGTALASQDHWATVTPTLPFDAIVTGQDVDGSNLYSCRAPYGGGDQVGKTHAGWGSCDVGWGNGEHFVGGADVFVPSWQNAGDGLVPPTAIATGSENGNSLYTCRAHYQGSLQLGKVSPGFGACFFPYNGAEIAAGSYEVLVAGSGANRVAYDPVGIANGAIPYNAIVGGYDSDGTTLYACVGYYLGGAHPGKTRRDWNGCEVSYGGQDALASTYTIFVPGFRSTATNEFVGGFDGNGSALGVCQVRYGNSLQVGKLLSWGACDFGYAGGEIGLTSGFEVIGQQ